MPPIVGGLCCGHRDSQADPSGDPAEIGRFRIFNPKENLLKANDVALEYWTVLWDYRTY